MSRLVFAALVALAPAVADGQQDKEQPEPKRPPLYANADTNDAWVYYNFGLEKIQKEPKVAADAFY